MSPMEAYLEDLIVASTLRLHYRGQAAAAMYILKQKALRERRHVQLLLAE